MRWRTAVPVEFTSRCGCGVVATVAELGNYGGRCRVCFDAYCAAKPEAPRRAAPRAERRPEEWARLPLATRQFLCSSALGMAGLKVYERPWSDIEPRDRLRIIAAGNRMVQGLAS